MENHDLLQGHEWKILERFGLRNPFWILQADTLVSTFVVLAIILAVSLYINHCLKNEQSLIRFVALFYVKSFKDLLWQTLKAAPIQHLAFINSLFTFILLCNTIQIIPFLEEPTKDLNTTLALGLIAFCYIQGWAIKTHGLKQYVM